LDNITYCTVYNKNKKFLFYSTIVHRPDTSNFVGLHYLIIIFSAFIYLLHFNRIFILLSQFYYQLWVILYVFYCIIDKSFKLWYFCNTKWKMNYYVYILFSKPYYIWLQSCILDILLILLKRMKAIKYVISRCILVLIDKQINRFNPNPLDKKNSGYSTGY